MPIATGQMIGDYEVIDLIDSSKAGVTYKVRNVLLQRFEALRVLPKNFQDDQDKVTRFLREVKVRARMSHPNVVTFYHATQLQGQLVMTTELVEGTTLAQRLELGALPLEEALAFMSQALSGIGHAHASGVVHRDINPSNIILTPDSHVKLTGFALAKATTDMHLTQPGTVLGSLDYISPEQVKGLIDLDGRADLYSLGIVLYEAVTGQKPFAQKSQFETMMAHVNTVPAAPSVLNPDLPAELSGVVLKAIAKDPAHRFQSADDFRRTVEQLRGPQSPSELNSSPGQQAQPEANLPYVKPASETLGQTPDSPWNAWSLLFAGVCTFLVVTIAMLAFYLIHGRS